MSAQRPGFLPGPLASLLLAGLAFGPASLGCDKENNVTTNNNNTYNTTNNITQVVGATGGFVENSLVGGRIDLPPGALSGDVNLRIGELADLSGAPLPAGLVAVSKVVGFEPYAQIFGAPVTISIAHSAGGRPDVKLLRADPGGAWAEVAAERSAEKLVRSSLVLGLFVAAVPEGPAPVGGSGGASGSAGGGGANAGSSGGATGGAGGTGGANGGSAGAADAGASGAAGAMSGGTGGSGDAGAAGQAGSSGGGTGGTSGGSGGSGGAADSLVRFAHLAPDLAAVDICLRSLDAGGDWSSAGLVPHFRSVGAAGQFGFPRISSTVSVPAGSWEVRVVSAAATSCATPHPGFTDAQATFQAGTIQTLAVLGLAPAGLFAKVFTDPPVDPTAVSFHSISALTKQQSKVETVILDNSVPAGIVRVSAGIAAFTDKSSTVAPPALPSKVAVVVDASDPLEVIQSVPDQSNVDPLAGYFPAADFAAGDRYNVFVVGTAAGEASAQLMPEVILCTVPPDGLDSGGVFPDTCIYGSSTK